MTSQNIGRKSNVRIFLFFVQDFASKIQILVTVRHPQNKSNDGESTTYVSTAKDENALNSQKCLVVCVLSSVMI